MMSFTQSNRFPANGSADRRQGSCSVMSKRNRTDGAKSVGGAKCEEKSYQPNIRVTVDYDQPITIPESGSNKSVYTLNSAHIAPFRINNSNSNNITTFARMHKVPTSVAVNDSPNYRMTTQDHSSAMGRYYKDRLTKLSRYSSVDKYRDEYSNVHNSTTLHTDSFVRSRSASVVAVNAVLSKQEGHINPSSGDVFPKTGSRMLNTNPNYLIQGSQTLPLSLMMRIMSPNQNILKSAKENFESGFANINQLLDGRTVNVSSNSDVYGQFGIKPGDAGFIRDQRFIRQLADENHASIHGGHESTKQIENVQVSRSKSNWPAPSPSAEDIDMWFENRKQNHVSETSSRKSPTKTSNFQSPISSSNGMDDDARKSSTKMGHNFLPRERYLNSDTLKGSASRYVQTEHPVDVSKRVNSPNVEKLKKSTAKIPVTKSIPSVKQSGIAGSQNLGINLVPKLSGSSNVVHVSDPRPLPNPPGNSNVVYISDPRPLPKASESSTNQVDETNGSVSSRSSLSVEEMKNDDNESCEEDADYENDSNTALDSIDNEDTIEDFENGNVSDSESSVDSERSLTVNEDKSNDGKQSLSRMGVHNEYSNEQVPTKIVQRKGPSRPNSNVGWKSPLARTRSASSGSSTNGEIPALNYSLFAKVPPTINFVLKSQKVERLSREYRRLFKWRITPITPNIVKSCLARSGFKPTNKSYNWLGCWGKHMKPPVYKTIKDYQKMNHFPGTFQLGRKDRLWRNLCKMQIQFGKKEFSFFPQTYVLPADMQILKSVWEDGGNKQKWIIKPPAAARGIGIKVIHRWDDVPKNKPIIVQKYLAHPFLINGSKFDMRIYVYVTSYDPLRIYVYDDGLARFASVKYSASAKSLSNQYMHLTNYSVNKFNSQYQSNGDDDVCQGHKWSLKSLWGYLREQGIDTSALWEKIKDLIIKTIISSEAYINSMIKAYVRRRYCVHELFGFDVLIDENLKPWIIEVNISPSDHHSLYMRMLEQVFVGRLSFLTIEAWIRLESRDAGSGNLFSGSLHSNSQLDINIKGGMIRDLFNIAGYVIPDKDDVVVNPGPAPDLSTYKPSSDVCADRRLYSNTKSLDEKAKHSFYCQKHSDQQIQATILDVLTPDDIRMLIETLDEDNRRGDFDRIFPSMTSHKYFKFFEQPRYYNLLLQAWIQRHPTRDTKGISMLNELCEQGLHLQNPTTDQRHQWGPQNLLMKGYNSPVNSRACIND